MAEAPFHDVRIHPRTGQETPINVGDENLFYTTDQVAYDPETHTVAAIEGYDSKYGVQLKGVPRTGSVKVIDVTEPTSPVELVQTNSVPATGHFWVSTPGAQSDYGFVNLGFGFVEVNADIDGHILEVHYQSLSTIPNLENLGLIIADEVTEQLESSSILADAIADGIAKYVNSYHFARDAGDTDHDLAITIYQPDGTTTTIVKRMDATFAEGTGNGGMQSGSSLPTSGVYYVFGISKDTDGTIDFIGHTSLSPTIPAGWSRISSLDLFRLLTDSSDNNRAFSHNLAGGYVILTDSLVLDLAVTDQSTTRITRTAVNAPPDVVAMIRMFQANTDAVCKVEALAHTDQTPAEQSNGSGTQRVSGGVGVFMNLLVPLNSSRQYATDATGSSVNLHIQFYGWLWRAL